MNAFWATMVLLTIGYMMGIWAATVSIIMSLEKQGAKNVKLGISTIPLWVFLISLLGWIATK